MDKQFDILLWGASGFTGQLVADYLARNAGPDLRWAIGGRNRDKLEEVRRELTAVNPSLADLPILIGNSLDRASLDPLVAQARVVCTTVGPYTKYGTPLLAACVEQGVDYCDITGETGWMRANIDAYHTKAEQTGARIVHCCGFDSIPSDLGVLMLQEAAKEEYGRFCHAITHYVITTKGSLSGGTIASMLHTLDQTKDDKAARRLLADPYNLVPGHQHDWSETDQQSARYDTDIRRWTGPFIMAAINSRVVRRSHALQDFRYGPQFRYHEATRFPDGLRGRLQANGLLLGMGLFMGLASLPPTRRLLEATVLPKPGEGPSAAAREKGYFYTTMLGKIGNDPAPGETWLKATIKGVNDPGYGETAKMLGESALCLAQDALPARGGILTPAVAMGMTLVERLRAAGMTFKVGSW
ncbi:MAG: saccharopine dehydrogenase NADP-binding domain-containing protein [Chloroflexota bacterium]